MDEQIKYRIRRSLVKENSRNYNSQTMREKMLKPTLFLLFEVSILLFCGQRVMAHQGHHQKPQSQTAPSGTSATETAGEMVNIFHAHKNSGYYGGLLAHS
jgi:hypothetical protein